MKRMFFLIIATFITTALLSKNSNDRLAIVPYTISAQAENKILSGTIYESLIGLSKVSSDNLKSKSVVRKTVILYFDEYPTSDQIDELEQLGVEMFFDTWTLPVDDHPLGFFIASLPLENLGKIVELVAVKKIDSAERTAKAMNNTASRSCNAQMAWSRGYTGKGVKICILDSGIDTTYKGSDLPAKFETKDYSYYPQLDNDVANRYTGHGTHVTATALGRGVLSKDQKDENNGEGAFKGMAPAANLVFLKIGQDEDGMSEDAPTIAAIDAAVNVYHADIISMSYGGWDDYHDGSSALDQKVDWAFSKGVPFFCSAGNSANENKHWKGTIAAKGESDFIQVNVSNPDGDTTMLRFNTICHDEGKNTNLELVYYDSLKRPLSNIITLPSTESLRGTESQYSYYGNALHSAGTYYLKVVNHAAYSQEAHVFEDWSNLRIGTDHVSFFSADQSYTIGSPSLALHAFSVGAYVSKPLWTSSNGSSRWYGASSVLDQIAPFSSRGPTMDGRIKPDLCAPGSVIVSLRDQNIYTTANNLWVDNDGVSGGSANYYVMRGTSMACPIIAGAAALYLEKYPDATPQQVYDAMKKFSNQTGIENLPDNTWGYGRLDIDYAMNAVRDPITVNGDMSDAKYQSLATYSSGRDGSGVGNKLGKLHYYSDGKELYVGITGEVTSDNYILLFFGFSGVAGKGSNWLRGMDSAEQDNSVFAYLGNVKMDFDVDFALGFSEQSSTMKQFYVDGARYGTTNSEANVGVTNQMGARSTYEIGSLFGGSGFITVAYDSSYSVDHQKGIEFKIPLSAFGGVDSSQTLQMFAVISSRYGDISNECLPGDPGASNPGNGANFSVIPNQDFFTQPVKLYEKTVNTLVLSNEGGLIDSLITDGYGDQNLYQVLQHLQPFSRGVISDKFMASLAALPSGSEVFTSPLHLFADPSNNPVGICEDGNLRKSPIYGNDYDSRTGFSNNTKQVSSNWNIVFTYAQDSSSYIDIGSKTAGGLTTWYNVFAIVWSKYNQLAVSPATLNLLSVAGSSATCNVTSNIGWSASTDQSWLTVSPSSGSGDGIITVTAKANATTLARSAVVTITAQGAAPQTVTVVQEGIAPLLSLSNASMNVEAGEGSSGSFSIYSNTTWSLSTDQSWVELSQTSGSGNKLITVTAKANPLFIERTATITVSATGVESKTMVVTQKAATRELSVSTSVLSVASTAGNGATFTITSNLGWTIASDQAWLTVDPDSGSGNHTIIVITEENKTSGQRTAKLTISAGGVDSRTITVTQLAEEAYFTVSAEVLSIGAANGSTVTFDIRSNITWTATTDQSWLSLDQPSGIGNRTVTLTAGENTTIKERKATVTVSASGFNSNVITVTQVAGAATLIVSLDNLNFSQNGGSQIIDITSNSTWNISTDQLWIKVNPSSGINNGSISVTVDAYGLLSGNSDIITRMGSIIVSADKTTSKTVTVTQQGSSGFEENKIVGIMVFPNPFCEGFYVDGFNERTVVSLFALDGRRIFRKEISSAEFISAKDFKDGVYVVTLTNSNSTVIKRIIKQ